MLAVIKSVTSPASVGVPVIDPSVSLMTMPAGSAPASSSNETLRGSPPPFDGVMLTATPTVSVNAGCRYVMAGALLLGESVGVVDGP